VNRRAANDVSPLLSAIPAGASVYASYAIAQVDYSGTETARLKEFEIPFVRRLGIPGFRHPTITGLRREVTFVDKIGFERKPRKLGAANIDVALRFQLELPNSFEDRSPASTPRVACRIACQRS